LDVLLKVCNQNKEFGLERLSFDNTICVLHLLFPFLLLWVYVQKGFLSPCKSLMDTLGQVLVLVG